MKVLFIPALNIPIGFILVSIIYRKSEFHMFFSFFLLHYSQKLFSIPEIVRFLYILLLLKFGDIHAWMLIYIFSVCVQLGFMTYAVNWEKKPCITRINFIPLWLFVMFLTYFLGHFVWKYPVHIVFFHLIFYWMIIPLSRIMYWSLLLSIVKVNVWFKLYIYFFYKIWFHCVCGEKCKSESNLTNM